MLSAPCWSLSFQDAELFMENATNLPDLATRLGVRPAGWSSAFTIILLFHECLFLVWPLVGFFLWLVGLIGTILKYSCFWSVAIPVPACWFSGCLLSPSPLSNHWLMSWLSAGSRAGSSWLANPPQSMPAANNTMVIVPNWLEHITRCQQLNFATALKTIGCVYYRF